MMAKDKQNYGRGAVTVNSDDPVKPFDYALLTSEARVVVQQKTGEIRKAMGKAMESIIEVGQGLIAVKQQLEHGQFGDWLEAEFGWTHQTANNYMYVAEQSVQNSKILNFAPSALYLLSKSSTPEVVRVEANKRAESGAKVTHKEVKALIDEHKPVTTPPKKSFAVTYTAPQDDYVEDVPVVDLESTSEDIRRPVSPLPYAAHRPFHTPIARPEGAALIQPGQAAPMSEPPRRAPELRRGGCYATDTSGNIIDTNDGSILSPSEIVTLLNAKAAPPVIQTVEVEARKPMLITVATGLDIPTEKLTLFVNGYKEPAARLGLELVALIGKKKDDLTAYMDALIAAVVVEKPAKKEKKPTTPKIVMDAMIDGIVEAFGWNEANITDGKWGEIRKAAKQLCMVNAKPEDMPGVHKYCAGRFISDDGKPNFGAIALAKYYADWKANQPKPITPQSDSDEWVPMPDEAREAYRKLLDNSFKFVDEASSEQVPA